MLLNPSAETQRTQYFSPFVLLDIKSRAIDKEPVSDDAQDLIASEVDKLYLGVIDV